MLDLYASLNVFMMLGLTKEYDLDFALTPANWTKRYVRTLHCNYKKAFPRTYLEMNLPHLSVDELEIRVESIQRIYGQELLILLENGKPSPGRAMPLQELRHLSQRNRPN